MDTADRPAASSRHRDTRSIFERFVEVAQHVVSRPHTLAAVVLLVVLWALTFPLFHHTAEWHATLHSTLAVISLMLLVLLENAARRDAQAAQEKLNVMSEALVTLLEAEAGRSGDAAAGRVLDEQADRLRTAVGLEDRH